jgi:hypothetical protein
MRLKAGVVTGAGATAGRWGCAALAALSLLVTGPARADDLKSATVILCTVVTATQCPASGDCATGPAWDLNIPQFIEIDFAAREMRTTKASGENRSTPIKNMEREDDRIFLQGIEKGRAFSVVITQETGMASVAVAREGMAVVAFAACTPIGTGR